MLRKLTHELLLVLNLRLYVSQIAVMLIVLAGARLVRQCQQKYRPFQNKGMIIRDELNIKSAPVAHRLSASDLTFSIVSEQRLVSWELRNE